MVNTSLYTYLAVTDGYQEEGGSFTARLLLFNAVVSVGLWSISKVVSLYHLTRATSLFVVHTDNGQIAITG